MLLCTWKGRNERTSGLPQLRIAQATLAQLCATYWYPLYAYLRRRGHAAGDAEDLTQGFFARMIEKGYLRDVERSRGRFRSFLLAALGHYVANERDYARAQRRGGGVAPLSLDFQDAEHRLRTEPHDDRTPDRLYERDWALALLERVLARLDQEWSAIGKEQAFELLKGFLTGDPPASTYKSAAESLGTTEGALKVAVHRLRKRYRAVLQEEIGATVENAAEINAEIRFLFDALSG